MTKNEIEEAKEKGYGKIHVTSNDIGILVASNAIIVDKEGRILIAKRSAAKGGLYALPGGTKQNNETFEECVAREMAEEIGLKLPASRYKFNNIMECFSEFKGKISNVLHFACVVEVTDKEKKTIFNAEPTKCDGLFWMTKEEILDDKVWEHFFLSRPNLENLFEGKPSSMGVDFRTTNKQKKTEKTL